MAIITERFKPSKGLYAGILKQRWLINNLWWLVLPATLFMALGATFDSAFFYVTAIYILCAITMSNIIVFYNYELRKDTVAKSFEQRWDFAPEHLTVNYFPTEISDNETVMPLMESRQIDKQAVNRLNISGRNLVITCGGNYDIFVIPLTCFSSPEDLNLLFKYYETSA